MNQYPNWPNIIGGSGTLQTLSINGQNLSLNPGGGTVAIPVTTTQPFADLIVSSVQVFSNANIDSNGDITTNGSIVAQQNITSILSLNSATVGTGVVTTNEVDFGGPTGAILKYNTPNANALTFYNRPIYFSNTVNFQGAVNGLPTPSNINTSNITGCNVTTSLLSVSTLNFPLSFEPSFEPNVEVNIGDQASQYLGKATLATGALAVVVSGVALGTGIAALANSRTTNYINSNEYETINGTTQLQVSTLADYFSTVYRFTTESNTERFVSTIYPPGQAIRSFSDPFYGVSTPCNCFQSFGQWVSLPAPPTPSITIPDNLSSLTFEASNWISTSQVRTSSILVGGLNGIGSGELSLTTPYFQTPIMRFGATSNTDGFLNAQGFNWTNPGQANTPDLKTFLIPLNNAWRIATIDGVGNNNIIAFKTDFADPQCSTLVVAQSSLIAGVSMSNGIINTPAEVQCLALETLNVLAFTGMQTDVLTTSTIHNRYDITTSSLIASTITTDQFAVNYGGTYIPGLSTNQLVQGTGYALDTDTNVPYLSTLNYSSMSLWANSPAGVKQMTEAPLSYPTVHAITSGSTTSINTTLNTTTGRKIFQVTHIISSWVPLSHSYFATTAVVRLATSSTVFWYYTYSINGGSESPLGGTSATDYYLAGGTTQFVSIAGLMQGIPLQNGDVVRVYLYGYVPSGTHTISNTTVQFLGNITPSA